MCSVCTGALLLAQAGVLRGGRATTHWLARDTVLHYDGTPITARFIHGEISQRLAAFNIVPSKVGG